MKGFQITVYGKVQGVWFRKFTQEKATSLSLVGYVMNLPNGNVFIETYGEDSTVNDLLYWLKNEGSPLSKVTKIESIELTTLNNYTNFTIKR